MTGYHTRWVRPEPQTEDHEQIMIREALAFGKALHDRRGALGLTVAELAELAERADMTEDEIECIEEGGTAPTIALLRHLAAALNADVGLTAGLSDTDAASVEDLASIRPARRTVSARLTLRSTSTRLGMGRFADGFSLRIWASTCGGVVVCP